MSFSHPAVRWLLRVAAASIWTLALSSLGHGDMFATVGIAGVAGLVLVFLSDGKALASLLRGSRRDIAIGASAGVFSIGATYPGYWLATALVPSLEQAVGGLYAQIRPQHLTFGLIWIIVAVLAEEVIWRGMLPEALGGIGGRTWVAVAGVSLYTAAQAAAGSWVLVLLSLAAGSAFMALRLWTQGLVAPLVCHLMWSPVVLLLYPLHGG